MKTGIFLLFFLLVLTANHVLTVEVWEFDYSPIDVTWPTASDWRR